MGCVNSKQAVSVTPAFDHSGAFRDNESTAVGSSGRSRCGLGEIERSSKAKTKRKSKGSSEFYGVGSELGESGRASSNGAGNQTLSFRLGNLNKYIESEQVAAGWPAWLSAVAGEAIQGWIPLRSDAYEKLEKIGQGTYSSVFRARELETGRIVALKKVRFDNFEPESVRFMAREIMILRRLDHPNIIKLEGLITSRLSCNIYLVFEYMDHDITGLLSSPDITFSESQIKCYMKQLISGLEHCHSRGVMHRDIKGSNLLVDNEGVLKVADFGLANFYNSGHQQPLTSRVVTLWYRPPELLLGSTDYNASVDLWSVGCVFAELLVGKPILQGRTEVEQLHKIFKLCGSPPDEYWKKSKLPHATLFKPQHPYNNCLRQTFKDYPSTTVNLLETLLSVEPYKRGVASSALTSAYFSTKPYACDPSSLPIYPPSKEIDAKQREETKRKKHSGRARGLDNRRLMRNHHGTNKLAPAEDSSVSARALHTISINAQDLKEEKVTKADQAQKLSIDKLEETIHETNASQGDIPFSGPLQVSTSSGFAWARRRRDDASIRCYSRSISRGELINGLDHSATSRSNLESKFHEKVDMLSMSRSSSKGPESSERSKVVIRNQWGKFERPDSFDTSDEYHSQDFAVALSLRDELGAKRNNLSYQDQVDKVEYSGPLLSQSSRVDELLDRHERHIRQTVRRSWFQRGKN
ncbi:Protein IMPAIRED IN BABA-INDUCED STERILITY 1, partial [Cucurbita argyrosperma subsp. sororia]